MLLKFLFLSLLHFFSILQPSQSEIVAFWHIYVHSKHLTREIIEDQYFIMKSSGLLARLDHIYAVTVGNITIALPSDRIERIKHMVEGQEIDTLSHLYSYCSMNKNSKVLYFHNKGSFHKPIRNKAMREALGCFVLTPSCIDVLDGYDTCGMLISPVPMFHYSGNFWWANCKYINTLINPMTYVLNQTFRDLTNALSPNSYDWCIGRGRYFAEFWVGSPPRFSPSDCFPLLKNSQFLYGVYTPNSLLQNYCPNFKVSPKMTRLFNRVPNDNQTFVYPNTTCGVPATLKYKHIYKKKILTELLSNCSSIETAIERSMIWYGQQPRTMMTWLKSYSFTQNFSKLFH